MRGKGNLVERRNGGEFHFERGELFQGICSNLEGFIKLLVGRVAMRIEDKGEHEVQMGHPSSIGPVGKVLF